VRKAERAPCQKQLHQQTVVETHVGSPLILRPPRPSSRNSFSSNDNPGAICEVPPPHPPFPQTLNPLSLLYSSMSGESTVRTPALAWGSRWRWSELLGKLQRKKAKYASIWEARAVI